MRYTGGVEICDRHAYLPSTEKIKYFLTFEIEGKSQDSFLVKRITK